MKLRFWITFLLLWLPSSGAAGVDQVYQKPSNWQTWGQNLSRAFNQPGFGKSYALVIGISEFQDFRNLGNEEDPIQIKNYLVEQADFDYVHLLTEEKVTLGRVRQLMVDDFPRRVGPNDRFLFYWVGHGETAYGRGNAKLGYLPLRNSGREAFSSMVSMQSVRQWDEHLRAKQVLYLLDACFSGILGATPQSSRRNHTIQQIARPSRQALVAGLARQETIVNRRTNSSVFTTAVLAGLGGEADGVFGRFGRDGIVSMGELEQYVKRRVDEERRQLGFKRSITPLLMQFGERQGDFFFFSDNTIDESEQQNRVQPDQPDEDVVTQSGSAAGVTHSHDGRTHTHALPTTGLNHTHGGSGRGVQVVAGNTPAPVSPPRRSPNNNQRPAAISLPNKLRLLRIPAGRFQMGSNNGSDDEKPVHTVNIGYDFYMSQTEITFAQYDTYAAATGNSKPDDEGWGRGTRPVINVSWDDAQGYVRWLSQSQRAALQGLQCRLPSEAEWEYAARAGTTTAYFWGNAIGRNRANCNGCGSQWDGKQTAPVGSFPANAFGLQDMHGNVWEWVQDRWHGNYQGAPTDGSAWETGDSVFLVVLRGGSVSLPPVNLRSANRLGYTDDRYSVIGFRIVCSPPSVR